MNEELLLKLYNKYNLSQKGDFKTFVSDMQNLEVAEGFYNRFLAKDNKGTVEQFVNDIGVEYVPTPARVPKTQTQKLQDASSKLNQANANLNTATAKLRGADRVQPPSFDEYVPEDITKTPIQPQEDISYEQEPPKRAASPLGYSWGTPAEGAATIITPSRAEQIRSEQEPVTGKLDLESYQNLGQFKDYQKLEQKIADYEKASEEAETSITDVVVDFGKAVFGAMDPRTNFFDTYRQINDANKAKAEEAKKAADSAKANAYLSIPVEYFSPITFDEAYEVESYEATTKEEAVRKAFIKMQKHLNRLDEALSAHLQILPEGERNMAIDLINGKAIDLKKEPSLQLQKVASLIESYKTTKSQINANVKPYENYVKDVTRLIGTYKDKGLSGDEIKEKVVNYLETLKVASPGYEAEKVQDIINIVQDETFVGGSIDQVPRSIMKTTVDKLIGSGEAFVKTAKSMFSPDAAFDLVADDKEKIQLERVESAISRAAMEPASKYSGSISEEVVKKGDITLVVSNDKVVDMRNADGSRIYFPTKEQEEIAKSFNPEVDKTEKDYRGMSILTNTSQVVFDMLPTIAVSALSGGTSTAVMLGTMLPVYGDYYNQALETTGDPRKSAIYAGLTSFAIGYFEQKFGNLEVRLGRTLSGAEKRGLYDAVTKTAAEVADSGIESYVKGPGFLKRVQNTLNKSTEIGKDVIKEVATEILNFPIEAAAGQISGVKTEVPTGEEVQETVILTTFASMFMSGANVALNAKNDINELIAFAAQRPEKFNQVADQWIEAAPNEEVKKARRAEIEAKKLAMAEVQDTFSYIQENNFDDKSKDRLTKLTLDKARALYKLNTATSQKTKAVLQQDIDKINKEMAGITPTEPEAVQDTENLGVAPAEEAKPKTFVGRDLTDGKKVYTDFDNTLYNPKTRELTTAGEELRAKLNSGELTPEDVEIITARSADDAEIVRKLFPELSITTDLSPEGKATKVAESNGNSIFIDDNKENLEAVKSGEVIDAKTIVPQVPKEVEAEKVAEIKAEESGKVTKKDDVTTDATKALAETKEKIKSQAKEEIDSILNSEDLTEQQQDEAISEIVKQAKAQISFVDEASELPTVNFEVPELVLNIKENPFKKELRDLGYTENQISSLSLEQQQDIVANKTSAPEVVSSAKVDSAKENSRQNKLAEMQKELDDIPTEKVDKIKAEEAGDKTTEPVSEPEKTRKLPQIAIPLTDGEKDMLKRGELTNQAKVIQDAIMPRNRKNKAIPSQMEQAISLGEITVEEAITAIESAGLEVPDSIKAIQKVEETAKEVTTTEQKDIVLENVSLNNASGGKIAQRTYTKVGNDWQYTEKGKPKTVKNAALIGQLNSLAESSAASPTLEAEPTVATEPTGVNTMPTKEKAVPNQIKLSRVNKNKRAEKRDNDIIENGTIYTANNDIALKKGKTGKIDEDGKLVTAHPDVKGSFFTMDPTIAEEYARNGGEVIDVTIPAGATVEVVNVDQKQSPEKIREAETRAINNSTADVVKLVTMDGKGVEVQYIINPKKTKQDANEKRRPAEVPVGKGSKTSQEVREGDTKGQEVATKSETKEEVKTKGAEVKRPRITTKEKPATSKEETKAALKEAELKLKDSAKEFFKAFTTGDGKIGIIFDPKAAAISRANAAKNFFGAIVDYVKAKVAAGKYNAEMFLADVKSGKFGDIEINQDGVEYIFDEVLDPGKNREQVKVVEQLRQEIENLYEQFENDSANLDQFEQRVQDIFTDLAKTQKNTRGTNFFFSPSDVKNLLKKASKVTTEEDLNEFNEMLESILEDKKIKKFKEKVDKNRKLAKKRVKSLKTTDNDFKNAVSFNHRDRSFQSADAKNNYEDVKRFNRFLETVNNPTIAKDKQFLEDKEYFAKKYREQQEKAAAKRALKNAEFDKDGNLIEDGEIITPFEKLPKKYKDEFNSRQMKFDEDGNLINDQGKIITPVAELSKKEKAELSKRQTEKKREKSKAEKQDADQELRESLLEEAEAIRMEDRPIHVDETFQRLSDDFLRLTKADLESLSTSELATLIAGFKSLRDAGTLQGKDTNTAGYEALLSKAKQEGIVNKSVEVLEKSSGSFRSLLRDIVTIAKARGKSAQDLSERFIKNTPLRRIDAIFRGKDGTYFYDTFLNPLAVGFGNFTSFNNRLKSELRDLSKHINQKDSLKLMLYAIDKQYKNNPDNDELNSIEEEILNASASKDENYKAGDFKLVKEIYEQLKKEMGGTFDYRKMDEAGPDSPLYIKPRERKLIDYVEKLNDSQVGKVLATGARTGKNPVIYKNYTPLDRVSNKTMGSIMEDFVIGTLDANTSPLDSKAVPGNVNARVKNQNPIRNWNYITANYNSAKSTELDYEVRQRLNDFGSYTKALIESLDAKMNEAGKSGDKALEDQYKAYKDFVSAMRNVTREVARDNFVASFDELSNTEKALNFASELGYAATLASVPRSGAELLSNVWFALNAYPAEFIRGLSYMTSNRDFSGLNSNLDKLISLVPTVQSSRLLDFQGSLYRDQVRETRGFGAAAGVNKASRVLERVADNVSGFNNKLNSIGDRLVAKPMWFGSFQKEFNKLKKKEGSKEKFDIERFIADEQYRFDNASIVEEATRIADANLSQGFSSFNPFESISDLNLRSKAGIMETFKRFLQRFIRFEYQTAEDALSAMVGRGSMSRGKGLQLMVATVGRMSLYTLIARALADWFDEFLVKPAVNLVSRAATGENLLVSPEDDEDEDWGEKVVNSLLGSVISLTLARRTHAIHKLFTNFGVESLNVAFGDELGLRKTEGYKAYENSLVFSTIRIPDIEGFEEEVFLSAFGRDFHTPIVKDMNIEKYLLKTAASFSGPYNPLLTNFTDFALDMTMGVNKELQFLQDTNPYKFEAVSESLPKFAGASLITTLVPIPAPRDVKRNIQDLKSAIKFGPEVDDPVYKKAMEEGATKKEQRDGLDRLSEIRKDHVEKMEEAYIEFMESDEWADILKESKEKAGRGSSDKFTTKLLSSKGKYLPERTYYRRGDSWFYEESGDEKTVQSESLLYQLKNRSEKSEYAYAWERFMIEMHKKSFLYQVEPKEISVGEFEFVPRGYKGTKLEQKYGKIAEIPGTTQFSISRFFN